MAGLCTQKGHSSSYSGGQAAAALHLFCSQVVAAPFRPFFQHVSLVGGPATTPAPQSVGQCFQSCVLVETTSQRDRPGTRPASPSSPHPHPITRLLCEALPRMMRAAVLLLLVCATVHASAFHETFSESWETRWIQSGESRGDAAKVCRREAPSPRAPAARLPAAPKTHKFCGLGSYSPPAPAAPRPSD